MGQPGRAIETEFVKRRAPSAGPVLSATPDTPALPAPEEQSPEITIRATEIRAALEKTGFTTEDIKEIARRIAFPDKKGARP